MNKRILFLNRYTASSTVPQHVALAGYRVDVALDLEAASRELVNGDYHLIILMENPYTESWSICEKIRRLTSIPLIVISSNASTETCVKAIDAGADYFMRKPFGPLELLARINSLLQRVTNSQPMSLAS
jgi:two-component system OmpR family response regulator